MECLNGQQQATINVILPQNSPKLFTRNPVVCFLDVDKTCVDAFGIISRFVEKFLESGNLLCSSTGRMKTTLVSSTGYPIGSITSQHLFQGTWQTLLRSVRGEMPL